MAKYSRRTFLVNATAAGASVAFGARIARASGLSPNETINVGMIGLGGRGKEHLKALGRIKDVRVTALCDPDAERIAEVQHEYPRASRHADLRALLDESSVDAVFVSTCNHWHCLAAVWACEAGKDVYVEKPLSHRMWEGKQLTAAAKRSGRIVQVGTQQRSDPLQLEAQDFLHAQKALGDIKSVAVVRFGVRAPIGRRSVPLSPPESVDYDLWLGPAQDAPIYRDKLHYDWHWDWNTGDGECGNWGVHLIDDVRNVVFQDRHGLPESVFCGGGRVAWNDAGNTPNVQFAALEAGGIPVVFALSNLPNGKKDGPELQYDDVGCGYVVECEGGVYRGRRGAGKAVDRAGKVVREFRGDSGAGHQQQFFDAIRSRNAGGLSAPLEIANPSSNWCHVINAAYLAASQTELAPEAAPTGKSEAYDRLRELMDRHLAAHVGDGPSGVKCSGVLRLDASTESFEGPGAAAANAFLGPPEYRGVYQLPAMAS